MTDSFDALTAPKSKGMSRLTHKHSHIYTHTHTLRALWLSCAYSFQWENTPVPMGQSCLSVTHPACVLYPNKCGVGRVCDDNHWNPALWGVFVHCSSFHGRRCCFSFFTIFFKNHKRTEASSKLFTFINPITIDDVPPSIKWKTAKVTWSGTQRTAAPITHTQGD